jgi:FkbM family methyltransferase
MSDSKSTPLPLHDLQLDELELQTPNGRPASFLVRHGTNDHNVVFSITAADEYGLKGLPEMDGWALDIGAHVGAVGICLAIDNPGLTIVAIEPVPDNAELARMNARRNGVEDRFLVLDAAVGPAGTATRVRYGFIAAGGSDFDHHAWVGNTSLVYADPPVESFMEVEVPCIDLRNLAGDYASSPPAFVKIDCEGGEWDALADIISLGAARVVGEWHPVLGRTSATELIDAFLKAGYTINVTGPLGGPGGFFATKVVVPE